MKLTKKNTNEYYINNKKSFCGVPISREIINKSFEFAFQMVFEDGHHRAHRSGGVNKRCRRELFANTFQGKIAEFILYQKLISSGLKDIESPDTTIHGKGIWDDVDLVCNQKKINIKSTVFFANLLLLEKKDWNTKGEYTPNLNVDATKNYDYFVLIRLKPDLKNILKKQDIFDSVAIDKIELKGTIDNENWEFDFAGVCTLKTIKHIIKEAYCMPQNSLLNGTLKMDASNYYIQCGNLKDYSYLIEELNKQKT
ncbi:hypothetical protein KO500_08485 [Cellulophaga baltica]|uniref:hypothetical protein n=1 Tax=Cellulophaga TaxID=104264 RepID=UPI001C0685F1|nr:MULTISPECIES: hypothetical protein [Cellulophaga]MBU2996470.1 hypothetical protein [Cellulophaga baltica]MDO6767864.1 hypothetical protein [Cellulophaga sp. 1_MG-2023]